MEVILDTNAVSAVLAADDSIAPLLGASPKHHHLPVVVLAEYEFGIFGSRSPQQLQEGLRKLESNSVVLPCNVQTAQIYATIRQELKLQGKPIPHHDIWIAALARQHDLEIVSRDLHFDAVAGVRRLGW